MLSSFRNRFGIPGVISVIALVFAMLGGAYAASNDGGGKATASAKAKKGPRGPRGPAGPAGPQGPAGPAGAKGDKGDSGSNGANGAPGKDGATGKDGTDGVSPVGTEFSGNAGSCTEGQGGVEFEGAEEALTYACNGKEGSPWTAGGTLPPGATETGTWALPFNTTASTEALIPVSFPIPLAAPISGANTTVMAEGASPTAACPGSAADPEAAAGKFCVYVTFAYDFENEVPINFDASVSTSSSTPFSPVAGAGTAGARLNKTLPKNSLAYGTWAVTAPTS